MANSTYDDGNGKDTGIALTPRLEGEEDRRGRGRAGLATAPTSKCRSGSSDSQGLGGSELDPSLATEPQESLEPCAAVGNAADYQPQWPIQRSISTEGDKDSNLTFFSNTTPILTKTYQL
ncbi:hypothetical protein CCR75_001029 [Bremia lactucae]|uniref:Uncharacterized protein n=1 Tax=Bremia lactucae TaxID=4779 RepID=A0A976NY30_BRELC|nr:hypothetical protein CCR75_001029 [Bremia lactucae]